MPDMELPAGTYRLRHTMTLRNGETLTGTTEPYGPILRFLTGKAFRRTIIVPPKHGPALVLGDHCHVSHLEFRGRRGWKGNMIEIPKP